jgi:hypothetical protein
MANPQIQVEIGAVIDGLRKGFGESVKIIETLENQARDLEKALNEATDLDTIGRLNQDLAKTRNALSQLRTTGVEPLTKATSQYNAVGVDFARIIQDAPFGIIGVGNNITQLAGSFQQLKNSSTSTGAALKTALSSIIAPTNLLVLGVSAVTTALTLYSQSAISAKGPIDDLKQAQDDYNDSLKETDRILGREVFAQFLKDVGLAETQNLGGRLIDVPTFKTAEEVISRLDGKIKTLRKGELDLLAKFLNNEIAEALRDVANAENELGVQLAQDDLKLYRGILEQVNTQLAFYKTDTDKAAKSTNSFNNESEKLKRTFEELSQLPTLGLPRSGDVEALRKRFQQLQEGGRVGQTGEEFINSELQKVKDRGIITQGFAPKLDEEKLNQFTGRLQTFSDQVALIVEQGIELAIGDFAFAIGEAFANGSNVVESVGAIFLSTLAGVLNQLGQLAIGTGVAIEAIKKAFESLGGGGAIVAGVALIALAGAVSARAKKIGGGLRGGSVGSSPVGGGSGSSFVGGAVGGIFNQNREIRGELVARGTDLVYVFNEANTRINKG